MKSVRILALMIAGIILGAVCAPALSATATAVSRATCDAQSCIVMPSTSAPSTGQEIMDGAGTNPGTPWIVTDHSGAPMAWVNLYGLYSGGDGGKMPGGLICVTDGVTSAVACLTPRGNLMLSNQWGAVTLTARDIRWLHRLERTHG